VYAFREFLRIGAYAPSATTLAWHTIHLTLDSLAQRHVSSLRSVAMFVTSGGSVAVWLCTTFAKGSAIPLNPAWIGSRARFAGLGVWLMSTSAPSHGAASRRSARDDYT
jgi:hypothetical protein